MAHFISGARYIYTPPSCRDRRKEEEKRLFRGWLVARIAIPAKDTEARRLVARTFFVLTSNGDRTAGGHEADEASPLVVRGLSDALPLAQRRTCRGDAAWPTKGSRASVSSIIRGGTSPPARDGTLIDNNSRSAPTSVSREREISGARDTRRSEYFREREKEKERQKGERQRERQIYNAYARVRVCMCVCICNARTVSVRTRLARARVPHAFSWLRNTSASHCERRSGAGAGARSAILSQLRVLKGTDSEPRREGRARPRPIDRPTVRASAFPLDNGRSLIDAADGAETRSRDYFFFLLLPFTRSAPSPLLFRDFHLGDAPSYGCEEIVPVSVQSAHRVIRYDR